jgi:FYVE/RhoGEF/PH domain-containing protein 5/6
MQRQQAQPESMGRDVRSLLIMPVQRIPRYNLLLQELLKGTAEDHPAYPSLIDALDIMKKVAEHVRLCIGEGETVVTVV